MKHKSLSTRCKPFSYKGKRFAWKHLQRCRKDQCDRGLEFNFPRCVSHSTLCLYTLWFDVTKTVSMSRLHFLPAYFNLIVTKSGNWYQNQKDFTSQRPRQWKLHVQPTRSASKLCQENKSQPIHHLAPIFLFKLYNYVFNYHIIQNKDYTRLGYL